MGSEQFLANAAALREQAAKEMLSNVKAKLLNAAIAWERMALPGREKFGPFDKVN